MRVGTAIHDKVRHGTGTVRRFLGDRQLVIIGLERRIGSPLGQFAPAAGFDGEKLFDHGTVFVPCTPELVRSLMDRYGVKNQAGSFTDMSGLIGQVCRYTESACGTLIRLDTLSN